MNNRTVQLPDLGPFRPLRLIGEGGMGTVYLAMHPHNNTKLAIKLLKPEVARDQGAVNRFLDVTRALVGEKNPHLAMIHGARRLAPDRVLLVMEYVEGEDLGQVLVKEGGRLEPKQVLELAIQIVDGLRAAHERGVLHLDLKPENVFVLDKGKDGSKYGERIKILDFGVALLSSDFSGAAPPPSLDGMLLGTPEYWSPEQAGGGPVDARSDLYSLGILMYELLAGETPFRSHSVSDVIAHHMRTDAPPLPRLADGREVPEDLEAIVLRCLAKEPADRFATSGELLKALERLRDEWGAKGIGEVSSSQDEEEVQDKGDSSGVSRGARDSMVGTVLENKYRLLSLIGEGGMGKVYEAEHVLLGRRVAVKMLRHEYATNKAAVQRFFQEAKAVNKIAHPNIVEVTDFVQDPEGDNYYIMELLKGESLDKVLARSGAMPLARLLNISLQVAGALGAAHRAGIVHRDLKPENIFLVKDHHGGETVKLLDFGVAKLLAKQGESIQTTKAGAILGTPEYMAPEQAASKPVDSRADIYALGVIMYEMATGRPPFKSKGIAELLVMHLSVPPTPPSQVHDLKVPVDPKLERIVLKCLEKEPGNRFQSMPELMDALRALQQTANTTRLEQPQLKERAKSGKTRWLKVSVSGAIAAMAVAATSFGYYMVRDSGVSPRIVPQGREVNAGPEPQDGSASSSASGSAGKAVKQTGSLQKRSGSTEGGRESNGAVVVRSSRQSGREGRIERASGQYGEADVRKEIQPVSRRPASSSAKKTRRKSTARTTGRRRPSLVKINFASEPNGALVFRAGKRKPLGKTPMVLTFRRSTRRQKFIFKLPGYASKELVVTFKNDGQLLAKLTPLGKAKPERKRISPRKGRKKKIRPSRANKARTSTKKNNTTKKRKKKKERRSTEDPF